ILSTVSPPLTCSGRAVSTQTPHKRYEYALLSPEQPTQLKGPPPSMRRRPLIIFCRPARARFHERAKFRQKRGKFFHEREFCPDGRKQLRGGLLASTTTHPERPAATDRAHEGYFSIYWWDELRRLHKMQGSRDDRTAYRGCQVALNGPIRRTRQTQ